MSRLCSEADTVMRAHDTACATKLHSSWLVASMGVETVAEASNCAILSVGYVWWEEMISTAVSWVGGDCVGAWREGGRGIEGRYLGEG